MSLKIVACSLLVAALYFQSSANGEMCTGCPLEFNPKEEGVDRWVYQAFESINSNSPRTIHLMNIIRATKQLVNGIKYEFDVNMVHEDSNCIEMCRIVLLSQPWLEKEPQLLFENCTKADNDVRHKRQLLGGLKEVEKDEMPMVNKLADYAVSTLDDIDTDNTKQVVAEVIDAKKQLVNGIMYHLELRVRTTSCAEGVESSPVDQCMEQETGPAKYCKIQIHRSWADKSPLNAKVVKSECEEMQSPALGGLQRINVNDDSLNKITDFALEHINSMSNSMYITGLVGISKAFSQVVAGMKYYLTMDVADTNCMKNSWNRGDVCKVSATNSKYVTSCKVVVWNKPWEKFMQVLSADCKANPVVNQKKQRSVPMPGGPINLDTKDSYVKELSGFALGEMDKQTNSNFRLGTQRIIRATSQVVSGVKITLQMAVGETSCLKGVETNSECVPNKPTKVCTVVIWDRPWQKDRRVMKSTCEKIRVEREILAGGVSEIDVNSPTVEGLKGFVGRELNKRINSAKTQGIVRVIKASTQVVAGSLIKMTVEMANTNCNKDQNTDPSQCKIVTNGPQDKQICDIEIWKQPWLNKTEMTKYECHNAEQPLVRINKRMAEQPMLIGGPKELDLNDNIVAETSTFALAQLDKQTNSPNRLAVHSITSATSQVVSGVKVTVKMNVGYSTCRKNDVPRNNCVTTNPTQTCTVVVLHKGWLNQTELLSSDCQKLNSKKKRSPDEEGYVTGTADEVDPKSYNVVRMIKYFLNEMDKKTHSEFKLGVYTIHSAILRVVAGEKLAVRMSIGESSCKKGDPAEKECSVEEPSQVCNVTLMDWTWMNKIEILNSYCENIRPREERSLVGAEREVDVNDDKITGLKEYMSKEITNRANSLHTKSVVKIIKATIQTVSGNLIRLTVQVGDTDCLKSDNKAPSECSPTSQNEQDHHICKIVIWEQPWQGKREVKSCECHNAYQPEPGPNGKEAQAIRRKRNADLVSWENLSEVAEEDYILHERFVGFVNKFNKVYKDQNEAIKRFRIFRANMLKVSFLQKTEQGTATYGATMFADLTRKEFKEKYLGLKPALGTKVKPLPVAVTPNISIPVEFDWREHNVVTPVKNQGMCGSCWAFSVTGNIEGLYAIKNQELISLSEQELVDCDKYDSGCKGGLFGTAYEAIEDLGGLELESDYPYEGVDEQCFFNKTEIKVSISGGLNISTNETDMAKWLVSNGPISVALNANAMQFYLGGVSHPFKFLCNPKDLDHGVLIVGYGVHRNWRGRHLPYWIVKNSWGKFWGKKGYYLVYRGDGTCGINQMPSTAILS